MKLFTTFNLGVLILVLIAWGVAALIWLVQDEDALDYSDLPPVVAVSDPGENGYTFITEFLNENEGYGQEGFVSRAEVQIGELDLAEIRAIIKAHDSLLEAFEESVRKPIFLIDVPATPDALIPSVSGIRTYIQVVILKSRLSERVGDVENALMTLLEAQKVIEIHAASKGGLITLLTSVAATNLIAEEIEGLLADNRLSDLSLAAALDTYAMHQDQFTEDTKDAYQQEFNFSRNCVRMIFDDPEGFFGEFGGYGSGTSGHAGGLKMKLFFNYNRTINQFYLSYAEIIAELDKPVCVREFPICEEFEFYIQDKPTLWFLRQRNPIGKIIGAILFPAYSKVLEVVAIAEVQAKATHMSFALNQYYLTHYTRKIDI